MERGVAPDWPGVSRDGSMCDCDRDRPTWADARTRGAGSYEVSAPAGFVRCPLARGRLPSERLGDTAR